MPVFGRRGRGTVWLSLLMAALSLAGCASGREGIWHTVRAGEAPHRIAEAYGIPLVDLLAENDIPDPAFVRPGNAIFIPGAGAVRPVPVDVPLEASLSPLARRSFAMPLQGKLSSGFGGREGRRHAGVDILAPEGTDVRAAATGIVLYAGDAMRGYGNVVILDHGEGVTSLYGHLKAIRVESGDAVPAGSVVGTVGRTGNATTSHLHFELRTGNEAVDPLKFVREGAQGR